MITLPRNLLPLLLFVTAGTPVVVAWLLVDRVRSGRLVRRALAQEGYVLRQLEQRYFTRGPFTEMRRLPGVKHSEMLYRVIAEDRSGAAHVLWARLGAPTPWAPARFEIRHDEAPDHTPRGIGAPLFLGVLVIVVLLFTTILAISVRPAEAASAPPHVSSASTGTRGAAREASAASRRRAEDLWTRTRATYAALQGYADTGAVEVAFGSAADPSRERHTFRTNVRKPRLFFFDFVKQGDADRVVVWSDQQAFHGWWKTTGVETDYPKGSGSTAFVTSTFPTRGSIVMIAPLIFPGAGLVGTTTEFGEPTDGGLETIDGHACHKLVGVARSVYPATGKVTNIRKTTIWVDAQSFLIRKVFEDSPKGTVGGHVGTTTTFFRPHANPVLTDAQFTFTPPESQE